MKHLSDFISEIVGETVFGAELNIKHESSMQCSVLMDGRTLVRLKFSTNVQLCRYQYEGVEIISYSKGLSHHYEAVVKPENTQHNLFKQLVEVFSV